MGVWRRGLALAMLAGCAPFLGEEGGPNTFVKYSYGSNMNVFGGYIAIDEHDRVMIWSVEEAGFFGPITKKRSRRVDGAYQAIVDVMQRIDIAHINRLCDAYRPEDEILITPSDHAVFSIEWTRGEETLRIDPEICPMGRPYPTPEYIAAFEEIKTTINSYW